ncbi:MAG: N-6 DNA methylase [Cytophagales bacterium]|jgi:type I restriction enzyme M protein|nr:N-6 DNA methylase [Cytophagales bacterium]MCA6389169.1 N-6 DNA methylase [Cytophagales bacterium]MCA6392884.1 N-6 DNA methylase [Cytophagales bacterium]MCA6395170.1 N-6 DNA methylase [Cytophagales bacterium]MCA6398704.1 N-6 DNA methylase [Cytophagales bacterium]
MLDTATKNRINDCRDILVGKLPDPKAQIEQITIGLIYKFMDDMDKEAIELGGKAKFFQNYKLPDPEFPKDRKKDKVIPFEQYRWDNLLDAKVTATEMLRLYSEAIAGMDKNPNIPQLFRDIFKNAYLPYRDPETLKLFLKTIGEFEYTHSEKLGDAFEYLLSVMGSQGDAGQFRTPRHIIDFLVAIVNPSKNDTILDPACGTAGFLISAFKHIKEQNKKGLTPDERKKVIQNFIGYDISPDMVRLSLVNLYLHGFSDPHIYEYDTLSSEERWNESFDVILANPPFMSPKGGIRPHKKFSIDSNRSEVLFVDYIAEHLNPKGKAGIIVPEGVIFQSGTAYKDLRKMLVENYLYAVVSLPAGVFNPYSGVKTSMLLMDKEVAKKRNEILFIKIDNDGYNLGAQRAAVKGSQLEEAIELVHEFVKTGELKESLIAHAVSKTEIATNGDYNLSGDRYKIKVEHNSSYDLVVLYEVAELQGGYAFKSNELKNERDSNDLPVIKIGNLNPDGSLDISNTQYFPFDESLKRYLVGKKDVLVTMTGATVGKTSVSDSENLLLNQRVGLIRSNSEKLGKDFLSKLLLSDFFYDYCQRTAGGGAQGNISPKEILNFQIPLPPLSIQQEIVAEIEGYQKIIDGAKAVVENYKPKIDIDPEWEMVELQEVCNVTSGGTPDRNINGYWNGTIPYIKTGEIFFNRITKAEEFITEAGLKNSSTRLIAPGTILMAMYGQGVTRGRVAILEFEAAINQAVAAISKKNDEINLEFLFYQLQGMYKYLRMISDARGGNQSNLNAKLIKELKICLPPKDIQQQIVTQIEKEQVLINANKQLIEIFEQKIKDRIAKVWGTS